MLDQLPELDARRKRGVSSLGLSAPITDLFIAAQIYRGALAICGPRRGRRRGDRELSSRAG